MGKKVLYKLLKLTYYNQKTPIKDTTFSFVSIYSKKQPPGDTLKNSTKFTGRHLCQSLFLNNVAGIRPATLLKKRPCRWCFPMNFVKFFRIIAFLEHLWQLLLYLYISVKSNMEATQQYVKFVWNYVINVVMVSSLLTLNKFQTLFWCLHCWLWTRKYWLENVECLTKNILH